MTGVQEDSGQSQTAKELDESREVETIRKSRSTKEVDKMAEGGDIEQVIEDYFEVKKDEEDDKEEGSGKKPVPKVTMWLSWWKKQWTAANDLLSKVHQDKEKNPGAAPDKDPDEAGRKPDKTCLGEHDGAANTKDREQLEGPHMFHTTKCGSDDLLGMKTKVSTVKGTKEGKVHTVYALADSGASTSIISWDVAKKVNMVIFEKGDATLKDASHTNMDVSGRGEIMVQEFVVGLEYLKNIGILHREFPKTLPERRRKDAKQFNIQYNSIRGDRWNEQTEVKEKGERARGVLLYLEEMYEQVDEKITNFDSFPEEIKVVLDKYINVFDTKLRKSMNVEPVQLNVRKGSKPYACFSCRSTPAHYKEAGRKLVQDLLTPRMQKFREANQA